VFRRGIKFAKAPGEELILRAFVKGITEQIVLEAFCFERESYYGCPLPLPSG